MSSSAITMIGIRYQSDDIDGVIANSQRLREAFERLGAVIPSAKGRQDDISIASDDTMVGQ